LRSRNILALSISTLRLFERWSTFLLWWSLFSKLVYSLKRLHINIWHLHRLLLI